MAFLSSSSNPYSTPLSLNPRAGVERPHRRELTKEEWEEVAFAFNTMDSDKTGFVNPRQLKVSLRALGFPVKKADVTEMLRKHVDEGQQMLDFETFRSVVSEKLSERTPQDDMRRAFQLLDVHGTGKIDAFTLRKVTKSLGMEISDAELQAMIVEFDEDKDGMINENEFLAIMAASQD